MSGLEAAGASMLAFGLSLGAVAASIPRLGSLGVLDVPNERSSHETPVPRGGGIGVIAGIVGGAVFLCVAGLQLPPWPVLAAVLAVAVLGAAEDLGRDLAPGARLVVQTAVACAVVGVLGPLERLPVPSPLDVPLGVLGWPLTVLWVVGVTNIFNFLDGIDGYAGLQGVVAGAAMALVGFGWVAGFGVVSAAACAGFLVHNWHPARVFMGDVGSLTLGFLFAVLPLGLGANSHVGVFVMGMALWFFLMDGTFTILRRIWRGEKTWQAHRSHLYQRLTIAGWSHAKVVLWVGVGMFAVAGVGVGAAFCERPGALWVALGFACIAFVAYWGGVVAVEAGASGPSPASGRGRHG